MLLGSVFAPEFVLVIALAEVQGVYKLNVISHQSSPPFRVRQAVAHMTLRSFAHYRFT